MSFDRPALFHEKTLWEALTRSKFDGRRLCFSQYTIGRRLRPNAAPGLFLGWRIDPGFRYRYVLKVLDYQDYRVKAVN